jgi:hypothetical protein
MKTKEREPLFGPDIRAGRTAIHDLAARAKDGYDTLNFV